MTKRWFSIYAIMAMILVLAACSEGNTTDNSDGENNSTTDSIEIEENDNNDEVSLEEEEEVEEESPEEDSTTVDESINEDNKSDETATNENEDEIVEGTDNFLNEAEQVDSDEQDFSIYLLPNYTLTSEEPGRDSLYLDEDGTVFMRIETMIAEEGTYDYLHENMLTSLAASSSETTEPVQLEDEASLPSGESIENAVAYTVNSETGPVTGMIFEREGMIVRLTIFDSPDAEHFNNFLSMGETIIQSN